MSKKRIIIFAHYYAPDTASTGQILKDQAEGMLNEFNVTVICAVPSYGGTIAQSYKTQKYYYEELNGVKIIRVRVPEFTKSNRISRIKNILSYFFGALIASGKAGKQDYVFTISQPPILGGLLGVLAKWQKHAKMIYCIQDFNPEQAMAVKYFNNKLIFCVAMVIDKFSCRNSNLVITVGRDLVETLKNRFKNKNVPKYVMINNWIDEKEVYPLPLGDKKTENFKRKYGIEDKFIIMYSGNIGLYYDLENIIKVIAKFKDAKTIDGREAAFVFVGDGTILNKLIEYKKKERLTNIVFVPYQSKEELVYSLNAGNVHWCVNAKGIKGVSCPSKIYGIMGASKPILGVLEEGSEARILIEEIGCGLVCEPGDYESVEKNIQWYLENSDNIEISRMGARGRAYLVKHLTKDISIRKYIEVIEEL